MYTIQHKKAHRKTDSIEIILRSNTKPDWNYSTQRREVECSESSVWVSHTNKTFISKTWKAGHSAQCTNTTLIVPSIRCENCWFCQLPRLMDLEHAQQKQCFHWLWMATIQYIYTSAKCKQRAIWEKDTMFVQINTDLGPIVLLCCTLECNMASQAHPNSWRADRVWVKAAHGVLKDAGVIAINIFPGFACSKL